MLQNFKNYIQQLTQRRTRIIYDMSIVNLR